MLSCVILKAKQGKPNWIEFLKRIFLWNVRTEQNRTSHRKCIYHCHCIVCQCLSLLLGLNTYFRQKLVSLFSFCSLSHSFSHWRSLSLAVLSILKMILLLSFCCFHLLWFTVFITVMVSASDGFHSWCSPAISTQDNSYCSERNGGCSSGCICSNILTCCPHTPIKIGSLSS